MLKYIWKYKCPRCREGNLFYQPLTFGNAYKMPSHCAVCSQRYEPEPGFYYGSMFISYILSAFLLLFIGLIAIIGLGWGLYGSFALIMVVATMTHTFFFRLSRSFWIHAVVRYDPNWQNKKKSNS